MADLRELLYEPWCPKCGPTKWHITGPDPNCMCDKDVCPPLATRMPEAVPSGLSDEAAHGWMIKRTTDGCIAALITDDQAELMFIGNGVLLIGKCGWVLDYDVDGWSVFGWGVDEDKSQSGGRHKTPIAALAAALHRLADERDAEKETT